MAKSLIEKSKKALNITCQKSRTNLQLSLHFKNAKILCVFFMLFLTASAASFANGQITFGPAIEVNDMTARWSSRPSILVDDSGIIYVSYSATFEKRTQLRLKKSFDGGNSFSPSVNIIPDTSAYFSDYDIAISRDGIVYVAWEYIYYIDFDNELTGIYCTRSLDGGETFLPSVKVDDIPDSVFKALGSITVDNDGKVYIGWMDYRNGEAPPLMINGDIWVAASTDKGESFSKPVNVDDYDGLEDRWPPDLVTDSNGVVYAVWTDFRNGSVLWNPDIYFSKSVDGGKSWTPNVRVDDNKLDNSWQAAPSMDVSSNGNIYVAWEDSRNSSEPSDPIFTDIYFAKSIDGGAHFEENVRVSDTPVESTSLFQHTPSLAVSTTGDMYITWLDCRYRKDNYDNRLSDIYFSLSTDGGESFGQSIRINDDNSMLDFSDAHVDVDSAGNAYVIWTDSHHTAIYFSKGIRESTGVEYGTDNEPESPQSFVLHQNYPNPFNVETVIGYEILDVGDIIHTILKIYNTLGEEVRNIAEEGKRPGYYTVVWDGKDAKGQPVGSGVYLYQFRAGGFCSTKKMILLK